jgi:hypothetical protein
MPMVISTRTHQGKNFFLTALEILIEKLLSNQNVKGGPRNFDAESDFFMFYQHWCTIGSGE